MIYYIQAKNLVETGEWIMIRTLRIF